MHWNSCGVLTTGTPRGVPELHSWYTSCIFQQACKGRDFLKEASNMYDNRLKQGIIHTLSLGHSNKIYLHGRVFPVSQTLFLFSLSFSYFAAKSLQSCPTLCNPIDGNPPGSPVPGILQARTLEWVSIAFSSAWKWTVKVKSLSRVRL